jgi:hypothetical protein
MLSEKIIGVWELQIWETVVDDKVVGYPLGENASGFLESKRSAVGIL